MDRQFDCVDVIFKSKDKELFYLYSSENEYSEEEWTSYSVKIGANEGWYTGTYKERYDGSTKDYQAADEQEIKEILSNITDFWIRGEF